MNVFAEIAKIQCNSQCCLNRMEHYYWEDCVLLKNMETQRKLLHAGCNVAPQDYVNSEIFGNQKGLSDVRQIWNVPRFPQIKYGLLKKTLRESSNLADLNFKAVVKSNTARIWAPPARKWETTEAILNSRKLRVKTGHHRNNNLQFYNTLLFSDELASRGLTVNFQICLIPGIPLTVKAKKSEKVFQAQ